MIVEHICFTFKSAKPLYLYMIKAVNRAKFKDGCEEWGDLNLSVRAKKTENTSY